MGAVLLPDRRVLAAWGAAVVAALLLVASLTGDGSGLLGAPALRHPGWSYALVGLAFFLAIVAARPRGTTD